MCDLCNEERLVFAHQFFKRKTDYCRKCSIISRIKGVKSGSNFGLWTVIEDSLNNLVSCRCNCGTIRFVDKSSLLLGTSRSCGCISKKLNSERAKHLINGSKYGRLTVIDKSLHLGKSICICVCENIKEYSNSGLIRGETKSCGCLQKECASILGKIVTANYHSENHPNWRGGISSERQLFNASKEAKQWRLSVFERDKYTCQICSQIGGSLNAHHKTPFAVDRSLRLELSNGTTLCESCHRDIHKIEGKPKRKKIPFTTTIIKNGECYNFS